jgi:uncharacterized protein DUF4864
MSGMRSPATMINRPASFARRAFLARGIGLALWAAFPLARASEAKLAKAQWQAIRRVISQQLAALRAGEAARAFGYASPGIQAQFGDAETFMAMVRGAYSALLVARYTEFLEGAVIDGIVIQPLRLVGPDNTVQVAIYTLERDVKRKWRINGCRLAPSTVQAA